MMYCYHRRHLFKLTARFKAGRIPPFPTFKSTFLDKTRTKQVYYHEIADETKITKKLIVRLIYRPGGGLCAGGCWFGEGPGPSNATHQTSTPSINHPRPVGAVNYPG